MRAMSASGVWETGRADLDSAEVLDAADDGRVGRLEGVGLSHGPDRR